MLVGEADLGPDYSEEDNLQDNVFGPDQLADVIAKYGSGPLVDAFRAATSPLADPGILGSFTQAVLVKTNTGAQASAALLDHSAAAYETIYSRLAGKPGNQIQYQINEDVTEVVPTTGSFTYIPNVGAIDWSVRLNGGADLVSGTDIAANTPPNTFVTAAAALTGVGASGGVDRGLLTGLITGGIGSLAVDANPTGFAGANNIKVTLSVASAWATTPTAGDTLIIPVGSVIAGASDENVGAYVIISATSTTINATKLSDAGKGGAVPGTITACADVGAIDIVAATDCKAWSPVTISVDSGDPMLGKGKSLEIAELTNVSTDKLSYCFFDLGTTDEVSWLSTSTSPYAIASSAEYTVEVEVTRASPAVDESWTCGGEIGLKIGYDGTSCTLTIAADGTVTDRYNMTLTPVGGSGAAQTIILNDYPSLQDLADYIDTLTGYNAAPGSAIIGFLPATALDRVSGMTIATEHGAATGRLKIDAYRFWKAMDEESNTIQLGEDADGLSERADAGLPVDIAAAEYMTGGTKGNTLAADIVSAIDALEDVRGNFLVPLFSRDATDDKADGDTESGSTYTIAAIHAAAGAHVTKMSTLKRRKNRQAILSIQDSFTEQQSIASDIGNFRCCMTFQNYKNLDSTGNIKTFQPWMGAVLAGAGQAAAFYKDLTNKIIQTSGLVHDDGTYNDQSYTQKELALKAGLLPAERSEAGGFRWVSDQTTYGSDSNFVFNSLQTTYVADVVAMSSAVSMQAAFLGQAASDVTAASAKAYFTNLLDIYYANKLLVSDDNGAPKGYKNVQVRIQGNAMYVSAEIKPTTGIKFILIDFYLSQASQSA
jgi:hypothetical protein